MRNFYVVLLALICTHTQAQFGNIWTKTYNGKGDFSDRYNCLTTDANGNIYLGGSTVNIDNNRDYLIEKIDAQGTLVWRKIFGAPGGGPDEVKDIVVDNSGRVFATGYGNNINVGNDFWTFAFNPSGDTLWSRFFNASGINQYDQANSIALDANGNIYVAGESDGDQTSITNNDYLLVKYDLNGTLLWSRRYNDSGNATDKAEKVVVDSQGNPIVTGRSFNGADDDYTTIKYDSNGNQSWIQHVDYGGTDRATDMDIDAQNNIYVTGRRDNGNDDDYCTVKYNSSGQLQLSVFFDFVEDDRAEAIDVNPDGSFAVTGRSDNSPTALLNWDYYTVYYNTAGTQVWAKSYNGSGSNDDWAISVALSPTGKVAVTGYVDTDAGVAISKSMATILYSNTGTALWTNVYPSALDDEGMEVTFGLNENVIACGYNTVTPQNRKALALIYSSATNPIEHSFDGKGDQSDNARAFKKDAAGNFYVAGYSVSLDLDRNMSLIKFNSIGDTLWSRHISGTLYGSDEEANAMAFDPSGNIIISGYLKNSGASSDAAIACYAPDGTLLWQQIWDDPLHESDRSYDLVVDQQGNSYLTGRTDIDPGYASNDEIWVAKYTNAGVLSWTYTYPGTGVGSDRGKLIRIAPDGNLYVIGRSEISANNTKITLLKISTNGQLLWQQSWDGNGGLDDPKDVAFIGNELLIGASKESGLNTLINDYWLLRISSTGSLVWERSFNGLSNGNDDLVGIKVDTNNQIYLTGNSATETSPGVINYDIATLCYANNGDLLWQDLRASNLGGDDMADALVVDNTNNIIVVGHTNAGDAVNVNYNLFLFNLTSTGNNTDELVYSYSDSSDVANFVIAENGFIYLAGSTWGAASQRDVMINKFGYTLGVFSPNMTDQFVYPNPANSELNIGNTGIASNYIILDNSGRLLLRGRVLPGTPIDISSLATGHYILSIEGLNSYQNTHFIKH